MKTWIAIGVGVIAMGSLHVYEAVGGETSKQKGIVNERSTGNEPFTGPGASGGPMHSSPGATDRTTQDSNKSQSGTGTGGSEKGAGASGGDHSKKSGSGR